MHLPGALTRHHGAIGRVLNKDKKVMKKPILPLMAALALISLGTADAHNRIFGLGGSITDLAALDTDGDGVLSGEELAAAKAARKAAAEQARLDAYDADADGDGDGILTGDEKAAAKAARDAERAAARQAIIDQFDANLDGVLNADERAAAKAAREAERLAAKEARFAEIDGDSDGQLTA